MKQYRLFTVEPSELSRVEALEIDFIIVDTSCSFTRSLVQGIRQIERAMGVAVKAKQISERACHEKLGKSVVSRHKLTAGTVLTNDHLDVKVSQPLGWPPQHLHKLISRTICKDVQKDIPITEDLF